MTPSSPSSPDPKSPRSAMRKATREAIELLKQSPSTATDSTPPHQNTRSKRLKPSAAQLKLSPTEPQKHKALQTNILRKVTPTGTKKTKSPDTPPSRKILKENERPRLQVRCPQNTGKSPTTQRAGKSPTTQKTGQSPTIRKTVGISPVSKTLKSLNKNPASQEVEECSQKNRESTQKRSVQTSPGTQDEEESPQHPKQTEKNQSCTPSSEGSVPPTPGLNTALIQTPQVDFMSREVRRKTLLKEIALTNLLEDRELGKKDKERFGTFESTNIKSVLAMNESSYAKPPRWSLRQLSPIRKFDDVEIKTEITSSFGETSSFGVEDVGVQVSLCQKCNSHKAWSEMKPIVMVFVLLMLSLLYRGLLRVDPRIPSELGNAIGIAVQGTFLASFSLEDYLGDIFAV